MKYKHNAIQEGNTAVGYALTGEKNIKVQAMGSSIKSNMTPVMTHALNFIKGKPSEDLGKVEVWDHFILPAQRGNSKTINIPSIPEGLVDRELLWSLDGALALEAFRTLYTKQNTSKEELASTFSHWNPIWQTTDIRAENLYGLWKVFNDIHVIQHGLKAYPGVGDLLQATQKIVWEYEARQRKNLLSLGSTVEEDVWEKDVLCYVRDMLHAQVYLTLPDPLPYAQETIDMGNYLLSFIGDEVLDAGNSIEIIKSCFKYLSSMDDYKNIKNPPPQPGSGSGNDPGQAPAPNNPTGAASTGTNEESIMGNMGDAGSALQEILNAEDLPLRRFYSSSMDIIQNVKQTYEEYKTTYDLDYDRAYDDIKSYLQSLRARTMNLIRGREKAKIKHLQTKGRRIDTRGLPEIITKGGNASPRIFSQKQDRAKRNTCISLMLDESGSMDVCFARQILVAFTETLTDLMVDHEVVGFACADHYAIDNSLHEELNRVYKEMGNDFNRVFSHASLVNYRIFKNFGENSRINSIKKRTGVTQNQGMTPLVEAIQFARARLLTRKEDQKLAIIITDGQPEYSGNAGYYVQNSSMGLRIKHCKDQLQKIKDDGMTPLLVVLDPRGRGTLVEQFNCPEYTVNVTKVEEFANVLHTWIEKNIAV
jgi:hypothetical protein